MFEVSFFICLGFFAFFSSSYFIPWPVKLVGIHSILSILAASWAFFDLYDLMLCSKLCVIPQESELFLVAFQNSLMHVVVT